jgi:hypothetical protein
MGEGIENRGRERRDVSLCSRGCRRPCLKDHPPRGELTDERRAHELAKENSHCLFDAAADVKRQWEVFERER